MVGRYAKYKYLFIFNFLYILSTSPASANCNSDRFIQILSKLADEPVSGGTIIGQFYVVVGINGTYAHAGRVEYIDPTTGGIVFTEYRRIPLGTAPIGPAPTAYRVAVDASDIHPRSVFMTDNRDPNRSYAGILQRPRAEDTAIHTINQPIQIRTAQRPQDPPTITPMQAEQIELPAIRVSPPQLATELRPSEPHTTPQAAPHTGTQIITEIPRPPIMPSAEVAIPERTAPRLSHADTVVMGRDGLIRSLHYTGVPKFISNEEILRVHAAPPFDSPEARIIRGVRYQVSEGRHTVIQQQATRGCTAATAEMIIQDRHRELHPSGPDRAIDVRHLARVNLGNDDTISTQIRSAGYQAVQTNLSMNPSRQTSAFFQALHDLIATHGPATASIGGEIGGHNIVVDTVNIAAETVTIRDPWHGWRITVPFSALANRGIGNNFVQIARTPRR